MTAVTGEAVAAAIEAAITALIREAPAIDERVRGELIADLGRLGSPLAGAIAEVVAKLGATIDPGIALPALAMACATLADGVRGRLSERELEAARYEIETLLPVPARAPKLVAPDVPADRLSRGSRPRS